MRNTPPLTRALAALCLALLLNTPPRAFAQQPSAAGQQPKPAPTAKPAPAPSPAVAQDEEEVIRLSTSLVQLTAVVTDKQGRAVENLSKSDFEVFENGQPREISFFSVERAPDAPGPAATTAGANDTTRTTNARTTTGPVAPARTVVLFVDTLHLSPVSLMRAKSQLKRFVDEQMTDADLVAVVASSGTLGILQQFTRDRLMLKRAIDKITLFPGARTSITPYLASLVLAGDQEAIDEAVAILGREEGFVQLSAQAAAAYATDRSRDILAEKGSLRGATLRALGAVSERLASMKGQRMIAFVSDGFSLLDDGGSDRAALDEAESRAARAGVMIYAVYPKGLVGPNDVTSGPVPGLVEGGRYQRESLTDVQSNLRELAQATGGEALLNTNDTLGALRRMLDANRLYYSLAYYLPKDSDKKFRKLTVRVKGHPEYSVRTQRGYAPPAPSTDTEIAASPRQRLIAQMLSPLPATALGVTSSADFLARAGDEAQVTVRVHIDGERLQYEQQGENTVLRCEIAGIVLDRAGKVADNFGESVSATLTPSQLARARREGYHYERRLKLAPGLYQVRVGVREPASERTGTSASWVEVPDLSKSALTLSSLFLGEGRADAQGAAGDNGARPKLAIGAASIRSGESIYYRFVAYARAAGDLESAELKLEIAQGDAKVYDGGWQPLAARTIRRDDSGVEAGGQLRLTLPPGVYTLRVAVRDAAKKTATREADFEVGQ